MSQRWTDIEGVTSVEGVARFPCRPEAVALTFEALLTGQMAYDTLCTAFAEGPHEHARFRQLIDWLPQSHVAWWTPEGRLAFALNVDTIDLCVRFAAWAGCQEIPADEMPHLLAYTEAIVSFAASRPTVLWRRESPPPAPLVAPSAPPAKPSKRRAKIAALIAALDRSFLERQSQLRFALLGLLAGQHSLLIGPPGTAKSLMARALCRCFNASSYFEYLLSRFTHPDELFGPVSIPSLKEEDYRRVTEGFLPQANVAFLDEIFKANSAILNSLLTLINERVFHHGRHRDEVPLIGLIGASNELPAAGLEALYDRFLFRLSAPPLNSAESFLSVCTGTVVPFEPSQPLEHEERLALLQDAQSVAIGPAVRQQIEALWRLARESEWRVSDRRWRQAINTLKVAAAAEDRDVMLSVDLLLLAPMLAPTPSALPAVRAQILTLLQRRAVPSHDLRTQWALLSLNRVAPLRGEPIDTSGTPSRLSQLQRRHQHAVRFIERARLAINALAEHRRRYASTLTGRLWMHEVPPSLLREHLIQSRDLADILAVATRYARTLESEHHLVQALISRIPPAPTVYGDAIVCALLIDGQEVALNSDGERVAKRGGALNPLRIAAGPFLDWLEHLVQTDSLCSLLPPYSRPAALIALSRLRTQLSAETPLAPPPLPPPHRAPE